MATGYAGYQGYGDPDRVKAERARKLAETLQQNVQNNQPRNLVSGLAGLAEAFIAKDADTRAATAESAYGDKYRSMAESFVDMALPDAGAAKAPLSLLPGDVAQTAGDLKQGKSNARDAQLAKTLIGMGYDAPSAIETMTKMKPAPKEYEAVSFGDGGLGAWDPTAGTMNQVVPSTPKPPPAADYVETQIGSDIYFVNKNNPKDKMLVGPAPPKAAGSGDGLSTYQGLQFQLKLDDLDRELGDKEKKRQMDLSTVDNSIALLDKFVTDQDTFNEVYGNMINPTGEGNDLWNPRVTPGSKRANGMAILEQIGGRAFLDSIGAMRGTGPLSDREGAKVGAAATRLMNVTQGDEAAATAAQEFRSALMAYKTALQQDIQNSRVAETARRQQMQAMMGRPAVAAPPPAQAPQQAEDNEDNAFLDNLFSNFDQIANASPPAGVDPEDWQFMTPEQKALFR